MVGNCSGQVGGNKFLTPTIYDADTVIGIEAQIVGPPVMVKRVFKLSSPSTLEPDTFSPIVFLGDVSYFVDTDRTLVVGGGWNKQIVRITRDAFNLGPIANIAHMPMRVSPGPNAGEVLYTHSGTSGPRFPGIVLKNIVDPSVSEVDLVSYFSQVLPQIVNGAALPLNDKVVDVAYDNTFEGLTVAVVTHHRMAGEDLKDEIYYTVYYAPKASPENWSKLVTVKLPHVRDCCKVLSPIPYLVPLASFPVVRDGVFMVSLANKENSTLTFFKADYGFLLSPTHRTVAVASVLRDWPTATELIHRTMEVVAQNTIDQSPLLPELQKSSENGSHIYKLARKALRAVVSAEQNAEVVAEAAPPSNL